MKFILWGHPWGSHTHSFIHHSFHKAAIRMGHEAIWLPDSPTDIDLKDCVVITEGQQDKHLPVHKEARYVLHNCDGTKYQDVMDRSLLLQVYTHDAKKRAINNPNYEKLSDCTYLERAVNCKVLYQSWATDLMPDEFDFTKARIKRSRQCFWVGTIGTGEFGNSDELRGWQQACRKFGITFLHKQYVSTEQHQTMIEQSYMAPAIVGRWQKQNGYLPCRIFKNVSYGQLGLTNSEAVFDLMNNMVVYSDDTFDLFVKGLDKKDDDGFICDAMVFVRDNHTYVNRINTILKCLGL